MRYSFTNIRTKEWGSNPKATPLLVRGWFVALVFCDCSGSHGGEHFQRLRPPCHEY